jgi:hypothetical protein
LLLNFTKVLKRPLPMLLKILHIVEKEGMFLNSNCKAKLGKKKNKTIS